MRISEAEGDPRYRFGILCLIGAAFLISIAGVLVRLLEAAGAWQILFYRSLALVATLLIYVGLRHKGRALRAFLDVGRHGLAVAVCLCSASILFILALFETTVANVVFTVGLSPFFAGLFAWWVLKERLAPSTLGVMAVSLMGIGLMFGDGWLGGTILGNVLALGCCLSYSAALVALRGGRAVDMIPAVCLSGVFAAVVAAAMVPSFAIGRFDLGIAIVLGVAQLGLQYILLTAGSRHVPAAEVALISRLNLVFAPLWVWLAVGEAPGTLSLVGGAVVLGALMVHGALALRRVPGHAT